MVEKLAAEKLVAEKLVAEKLVAEKLAVKKPAERQVAEKLAVKKPAEKLTVEQLAEKLAVEKLAVEKWAAEKWAVAKLAAEKLAAVEGPRENSIPDYQEIGERLKDLIRKHRKGLQKMYGETEDELDKNLESPIKRGEEMANRLITEMRCPRAIAKDLAVLTLYDVAILICMFQY